ncbi:alpha/beta fold hydrolase [Prauserella flavalba]|uniref:AB hydrolase-1 domain-containing protein n=1 Tax=Prauserella flavalba TaxID=1477506 RepID=A0A318LU13_9PSEU|nr:alpha/beta fold hydrolase [Prauserella flavalba]PXY26497.1 hypothetical protein BA062_24030 [Prauserella flavalba]
MTFTEIRQVTAPDGCRLAYRDLDADHSGAVVLLHSLGADGTMWEPCAERLTDCFRVIIPDSRGHGASGRAPRTSVDQWAEDIATVLHHAGVQDALLAGVSMGGIQALAYAAAYPGTLCGLVVADSFASLPVEIAAAKIASFTDQAHTTSMAEVAATYVADTFREPVPSAGDAVRHAMAGLDAEDFVAAVEACFGAQLDDRLSDVKEPVRVLWGERDGKTPRALSESIVRQLPEATLRVIPGAGHLSNVDNPDVFATELREFKAALRARPASEV